MRQEAGTSSFTSPAAAVDVLSVQAMSAGILGNVLTLTLNRPVSTANFFDFQYGGASRVKVIHGPSCSVQTSAHGSGRIHVSFHTYSLYFRVRQPIRLRVHMSTDVQAARNGLVTVAQGGIYVDAGAIGVNAGLITSNSILTVVGDASVVGPSAVGPRAVVVATMPPLGAPTLTCVPRGVSSSSHAC